MFRSKDICTSQRQIKIEEFGNLYQMKLDPKNRWVLLANTSTGLDIPEPHSADSNYSDR